MSVGPLSLVNGAPTNGLDIDDRGLNYGDGLFETIAVRGGEPLLWQAHMRRLTDGARRLALTLPDPEVVAQEAGELCAGVDQAILKLIVTRGRAGRGYTSVPGVPPTRILRRLPAPSYPSAYRSNGVRARFCQWRLARDAALAGIKHLNRLPQVMARLEWGDEFEEGLMLDDVGAVIEGTRSNLFIVSGDTLRTPDLSLAGVCGVARGLVMEQARAMGIQVSIQTLSPETVRAADELFLTNSLIGLWPVRQLEGKTYTVGPVTRALQEAVAYAFPVFNDL